jgi:hypothetical protein
MQLMQASRDVKLHRTLTVMAGGMLFTGSGNKVGHGKGKQLQWRAVNIAVIPEW